MTRIRSQRGVTLIELMISMVILTIAVSGAFLMGASLKKSYIGQRRAMHIERVARALVDYVGSAARAASPGVRNGIIHDCVKKSAFKGLEVIDGDGAAGQDDLPDELRMIWASGTITTSRQIFDSTSDGIEIADGTQFRPGDYVLISNLQEGHVFLVDSKQSGSNATRLVFTALASSLCPGANLPAYDKGAVVMRVQFGRFWVDTTTTTLMMDADGWAQTTARGAVTDLTNAEPIGLGVEDMQIAVGTDEDPDGAGALLPDGIVTEIGAAGNDDEWYGNHPNDGPAPTDARVWQNLRITLTVRSQLEGESTAQTRRPAAENRLQGALDPYRRRTMATQVQIRNLRSDPALPPP